MSDYEITVYDKETGEDLTFYVNVSYYSPFKRGVYNALPENCYPDEPEEVEFDVVKVVRILEDGSEEEVVVDIDPYSKEIEEKLLDKIREDAEDWYYGDY